MSVTFIYWIWIVHQTATFSHLVFPVSGYKVTHKAQRLGRAINIQFFEHKASHIDLLMCSKFHLLDKLNHLEAKSHGFLLILKPFGILDKTVLKGIALNRQMQLTFFFFEKYYFFLSHWFHPLEWIFFFLSIPDFLVVKG